MDVFFAATRIVLTWLDMSVTDANAFDEYGVFFGVDTQNFACRSFVFTSDNLDEVACMNSCHTRVPPEPS